MRPGFVLIHGYTGSPGDFGPLPRILGARYGENCIRLVRLPGHGGDTIPCFEPECFQAAIAIATDQFKSENRDVVLVGHSTGGVLALSYLRESGARPCLLVLAGVPKYVNGSDLHRWEDHRLHKHAVSLTDVARMVSFVNRIGAVRIDNSYPVLIFQGIEDPLVTPVHAEAWRQKGFSGPVETVMMPGAGHDLFLGSGGDTVADRISRTALDLRLRPGVKDHTAAKQLSALEDKALAGFMGAPPQRLVHVVRSPAAKRALGRPVSLKPAARTDPLQLNIEITSRCNLSCGHCARTLYPRPATDMARELFCAILDLLPNTCRVVLVGLGEPTLHPELADLVALAAQRGRRVGLVTNAMALDKDLSRNLIAAGLSAITFSLDSADAAIASAVRPGTELERVLAHIRSFTRLSAGRVSTAVFSAVSTKTAPRLPLLAETLSGLGIDAWMLSDLNFEWNVPQTLWRHRDSDSLLPLGRAVKIAFSRNLPALSVRGMEEFGIARRYREFLLYPPSVLSKRSTTHTWCLSPWQTLPVDVDGNVTLCDCQPEAFAGSLLQQSFSDIWNGAILRNHRRQMLETTPPKACRSCPRF
jgi:MoaA/NifB/PqqE/SkfB family radical SAM enzyme/pimeloyl-ACP methyl ester carboxylesterase